MDVSFVERSLRPPQRPLMASTSARAERNLSFSSLVPTVVRRQPSRPGQLEVSRTSTERSTRPCHTSRPGALLGPPENEIGLRRPDLDRHFGKFRHERVAFGDYRRDTLFHLLGELQRQAAGRLLQRVQVVGQGDALQHLHDLRRPDQVTEAQRRHRPGLRIGADHRPAVPRRPPVRVADQWRTGRRPRRPPPALARRATIADTVEASSAKPVGLFGEHRKTIEGCSLSMSSVQRRVRG